MDFRPSADSGTNASNALPKRRLIVCGAQSAAFDPFVALIICANNGAVLLVALVLLGRYILFWHGEHVSYGYNQINMIHGLGE
jgi:hypothetical protein